MNGGLFLTVRGIVQGVGFRPFVHRLASENNLGGWVFGIHPAVWKFFWKACRLIWTVL